LPAANEVFVLRREAISFKIDGPDGKFSASGVFFLTNYRIVFLKSGKVESHKGFSSFEIPMNLISNPDFKQPIFGANYMEGHVNPIITATSPVTGPTKWYLTFNRGGCNTFLRAFFPLLRSAINATGNVSALGIIGNLHQGQSAAFVDPSDPSIVYVSQPVPSTDYQPLPSDAYIMSGATAPLPPPDYNSNQLHHRVSMKSEKRCLIFLPFHAHSLR